MRWLLALLAMTLLGLNITACGGAGKGGKTSSDAPSNVAATGDATAASSTERQFKRDTDKDNDNPTDSYYDDDDNPILHYGQAANVSEARVISKVIGRYYTAAAAANGAAVCSLLNSVVAGSIVEEYGQGPGRSGPPGKTCATVVSRLFKRSHRELADELSTLEVTSVRVEGQRGWALLRFGSSRAPGRMLTHREGSVWKIGQLLRSGMP
jgi:hypothetical protein